MTHDPFAPARDTYDDFLMAFHDPRELAVHGWTRRAVHALMTDWLRNLESVIAHLLVLAAAMLDLPPPRPRAKRRRIPGLHLVYPAHPETWRTSFRIFRRKPRASRHRKPKPPADPHFPDRVQPLVASWRCALRLEAIRRVLSDPDAAAKRLARRLARMRADNARANEPRYPRLPVWDFTPERRTTGKHAVARTMNLVVDEADEALWRLLRPG
jgi:hypothetical protein